jgi:hypothetical protein
MNTYETTATVEDHGQVRLVGVPFQPGTEVEVIISPKVQSANSLADPRSGTGLRWEGNVLVHEGLGAGASVAELRQERLNRLGGERSG